MKIRITHQKCLRKPLRLYLYFVVFLAGMPTMQSCLPSPSDKPLRPSSSGGYTLSMTGEELYVKHCKLCHGIDGSLELNGAKDLRLSEMSLAERITLIIEGKNAMTPFEKVLSEEQIRKVATYSLTLTKSEE